MIVILDRLLDPQLTPLRKTFYSLSTYNDHIIVADGSLVVNVDILDHAQLLLNISEC